jgi:predicted dehydrogenase
MRVLFAGLGSIGRRHLRLLQSKYPSFDYIAYRSGQSDEPAPKSVTEFSDLEEALSTDPDIAFITNPTALHVQVGTRCAEAGCHIFVEKPLSHSLEGVDELIAVADDRDLVTHVGCQLRFHPVLQTVRSWLDDGVIGDVYGFRAYSGSYLPDWQPERDCGESYRAKRKLGGGVVLDLIHEIDYANWLFGPVDSVTGFSSRASHLPIETEDIAEIVLDTRGGAVGSVHLDYVRRTPRRDLEVIGEKGVIEADLDAGTVAADGDTVRSTDFEFERDDLFREQRDYFLDRIRSGSRSMNDLREAKQVLQLALKGR